MQITKESEFALQILCALCNDDHTQNKDSIIQLLDNDESAYNKIIKVLNEKDIIRMNKDNTITMIENPYNISVLSIINLFEENSKISHYLEKPDFYDNDIVKQIRKIHAYVQKNIEMCYGEITIATVFNRTNNRNKKINHY